MEKIYLEEEGFPLFSITKDKIVTNEKTGRILTIKTDGCFECKLGKTRKNFSLNKIYNKYFIEPDLPLTPIPNFEKEYSATEDGRIYSHIYGKFLSPWKHKTGYLCVHLRDKTFYLHRVIAITFIPNPNHLPEVNHKDEIKTNCAVSNLEWCNRTYNVKYGTRTKRAKETLMDEYY